MKIGNYYDHLPPADAFLCIDVADGKIEQILPDFTPVQQACICIYGPSEPEIDDHLLVIQEKADEYAAQLTKKLGNGAAWDIQLKPVLLFDNKACTFLFQDFITALNDDDFYEFIDALQAEYNHPWTHIQMITHAQLQSIIGHHIKSSNVTPPA